jgi:hypothetical protein
MPVSTNGPEWYARPGQTTGRRLELWLRPGVRDAASDLVTRARSLAEEDAVEGVDVRMWDTHQDLSSPIHSHREREARAMLQTVKRWAWHHGSELLGFGPRRRAGRGRMGPEYVVQRVPPVLLAEYDNDVLVNVSPCAHRERCVTDRLDALAAADADADSDSPSPRYPR